MMDEMGGGGRCGGGISPNAADRQNCLTEADKAVLPATWGPEYSANIIGCIKLYFIVRVSLVWFARLA